jgi:hypothetical protein
MNTNVLNNRWLKEAKRGHWTLDMCKITESGDEALGPYKGLPFSIVQNRWGGNGGVGQVLLHGGRVPSPGQWGLCHDRGVIVVRVPTRMGVTTTDVFRNWIWGMGKGGLHEGPLGLSAASRRRRPTTLIPIHMEVTCYTPVNSATQSKGVK